MNSRKNKFMSGLLSFVMMFTLAMQVLPPVKVHAAALNTPTITSPDEDVTYYDTASISFKWGLVSGATYYQYAIKDMTSNELLKNSEYYTSRSVTLSKSYLEPGHEIKFAVGAYNDDGKASDWATVYITIEKELEEASTTFALDYDLVTLGETIGLSGKVNSGDYYIRAIEVNIRNSCDPSHGYNHQRVEFDYSDRKTSYSLSNFDDIETGMTYACSGCGKKETLGVGEHEAVISVGLYSPTGGSAEGFTESGYYFEVEEPVLEEASTTFALDYDLVTLGETIGLSGKVNSGDYYIRAIEVNIRNSCDPSHGYNHQRVEFDYSDRKTSYSLSNFDDIETGMTYTCSGCGKKETLGVGEHEAVISVGLYSPTGGSAEGFTQDGYHFSVTASAGGNAIIHEISASNHTVSVGEKIEFTVEANTNVYGVEFHVKDNSNDYTIGSVKTVSSSTSTTKTFIFKEYSFNSTGLIEDGLPVENTRQVWVYPIDKNGNAVVDDSAADHCEITVTPSKYSLSDFAVYTTEVDVGNSATIHWSQATAKNNDTVYYNVYIGTKTSMILLTPKKITSQSVTVPSSLIKELGTGTYAVMVIATAADHSQKQKNSIITINANTRTTDTTKPLINTIDSSADPIVYGTSVTFSTAASDETALDKLEMYIDNALVKTVSAADTYANITYTTNSLSTGTHTVLVKAYDESGNYNSLSQSFHVEAITTGIIYDVALSDYDFYAGSYITFTVTTSTDTAKIRLVDGSYVFSVQSSGYTDSNGYRIWEFEQYVGTVGTDRTLHVESYSGGWTGNYWTTAPFTVRKNMEDVGNFVILSPVSGSKHQFHTALTVTWSEPEVKPDWYVVNVSGVPSGSDLISIRGNTAVIDGSVFDEYDTYAISVTAQKEGYNQSKAYVNVTVGCLHENKTQLGVKYGSETYYSDSKHKVTVTPKYLCNTCGGTFTDTSAAYTEYVVHDHGVELDNNGWFCDCGYVDSGSYTPWAGYLQSNSKEKAYSRVISDGELTNWDGVSRVYPEDTITVVGTKYDAFLIQYSLSSGGTKTRFVDRTLVDRTGYTGREIVYISIDGVDLRCVQEGNGTLYAAAYDFASALNGSCSFISNNKLNCRMKVYDTVSALNYYWAIDLRNYSPSTNWTNIDAYTDELLTTLAKADFAGAYVYGGDINISINGVLELLSYKEIGEHAYSKKDIDCDLIKTAQAIRDTDGQFKRVFNMMDDGMLIGEYTTYLYSISKGEIDGLGNAIIDNTFLSNASAISSLKQTLVMRRTEEHDKEARDHFSDIVELLNNFVTSLHKIGKLTENTINTADDLGIELAKFDLADEISELEAKSNRSPAEDSALTFMLDLEKNGIRK